MAGRQSRARGLLSPEQIKDIDAQADALVKEFESIGMSCSTGLEIGIDQCTKVVQKTAKELVNKDTELLMRSIATRTTREGNIVTGEIGTGVDYAEYQEFLPPPRGKPYLTPGLEMNASKFPIIIADAIVKEASL